MRLSFFLTTVSYAHPSFVSAEVTFASALTAARGTGLGLNVSGVGATNLTVFAISRGLNLLTFP